MIPTQQELPAASRAGRRIVLVSDDPQTHSVIKYLEKDNFAKVITAATFGDFAETLRGSGIDAALIDMTIAEDAEEILEIIGNVFPDIPAIIFYDRQISPVWNELPALGAVSSFSKPLQPESIAEVVINYIGEAEEINAAELPPPAARRFPTVQSVREFNSLKESGNYATLAPVVAMGAYFSARNKLKTMLNQLDVHLEGDLQNIFADGRQPVWSNVEAITAISSDLRKIFQKHEIGDYGK